MFEAKDDKKGLATNGIFHRALPHCPQCCTFQTGGDPESEENG
jgi:hypothetical protein